MIIKGKQAKKRLLDGINQISDVVKITLGAKGKTVLISDPYGLGFRITKDGVSVAKSVKLEDEIESCGADFIKNAAIKTVNEAGDGTSTTTILTQSMCNSVYKEIELGENPNNLIKDLKEDLKTVSDYIKDYSRKIENTDDIQNIARVSSNNDEEISRLIKDIYDKAGMKVAIDITESDTIDTSYEIVNGYTMKDTGYSSNVFINNFEKNRVEYQNPKVYLYNGKIKFMTPELMELFRDNSDRNSDNFRPLVLIVEDIEEAPLREIVLAYEKQLIFNVAIVQSNLIFDDRKNAFIDSSIVIDAEYTDTKFGKYGECEKIIIEKDNVTFINGKGNTSKHIENLRKEFKKSKNIGIERRLFSLESVAAIIKVGGKLGTEISEKIDRIDDAVQAVKSALEEGYCSGASSVYISALNNLDLKTKVMQDALLSCFEQLMNNAEIKPWYYLKEIETKGKGFGFNLLKEEISDLYKDGIIDSSKVLRVSLENAVYTTCDFALINATVS